MWAGERNERKRQGRLRLRVARGRMRTDRGRLMTYKHTYIHTNKIAIEFTSTGSLRSPNYVITIYKTKQCKDNTIPNDPNVLFEHFKLLNKTECAHLFEYVPVNGPVSELDDES